MVAKKPKSEQREKGPGVHQMFQECMEASGRFEELKERYDFHREFGMQHSQAMWAAMRDLGWGKEPYVNTKALEAEYRKLTSNQRRNERRRELRKEKKEADFKEALEQLRQASEDKRFEAVSGIEWVAANFHNEKAWPGDCPHIIAWNVLQTSRKYEVAFFKDFLMKALSKGVTLDNSEEFAEDESDLDDLRQAVKEAIGDGDSNPEIPF